MKSNTITTKAVRGKIGKENLFHDLIQEAYKVFKQSPTEHGVCDCCMSPKIRNDFFNHKQEDIPLEYINDWFFAAADMPLSKDKWRFVLPRILEVLASGEEPSTTGIEVSLNRFSTGDIKNWNNEEWSVLDNFQRLFLVNSETIYCDPLDDIVCMFSNAGWPTMDLFTQISEWSTETLVNRLWNDWCRFPNPSIWITAFWEDEFMPRAFYTSDELLDRIVDYALHDETPHDLSEKAISISDLINSELT